MTTIPETEVIARLRNVVGQYESQIDAALTLDVAPSYLSDVLRGHKTPSQYLLSLVGLKKRRVTVYEVNA